MIFKPETMGTGGLLPHQGWGYVPGICTQWFIVDQKARLRWRAPNIALKRDKRDEEDEMTTHRTFAGNGGWWGRLEKPGWFMERGPYPFRWMAELSFPISRWTWR